ncbi:MAG: hypothetical protein IPK66_14630 [Rhodospirillales bacterium]|nr:hypothetical protein [Rhodospirillales bacterium]
MKTASLIILALLVPLGVTSCETSPAPPRELSFVHASPILLNVGTAEIDSKYHSSSSPPNIEGTVTPSPEGALIRWAQQRLRSVGTQNVARFTVLNAPLTAETLPASSALSGVFGSAPGQRWTVTLEAQIEIFDDSGSRLDGYSAKVSRTRDMEGGLTYEERNRRWFEMLSATMNEFDSQMESGLRQYAGSWLR